MWEMVVHTTADSVLFDGVNASFPTVGALLFSCGGMGLLMKLPLHGIHVHKVLRFLASGCLVVYIFHLSVFKFLCDFLDVPQTLGVGSGILLTLLVTAISFGMGWLLRQIPGVRMLVKI